MIIDKSKKLYFNYYEWSNLLFKAKKYLKQMVI